LRRSAHRGDSFTVAIYGMPIFNVPIFNVADGHRARSWPRSGFQL